MSDPIVLAAIIVMATVLVPLGIIGIHTNNHEEN